VAELKERRLKPLDHQDAKPGGANAGNGEFRGSVSIIAVCYNQRPHIEPCLSRLLAQTHHPVELILVDNASVDGSAGYAIDRFAGKVTVVSSDRNAGYLGGVNLGLQHARGDYVAVLNVDTEPAETWLAPLVAFLDAHSSAGAVTSKVLLAEQPEIINACGLEIHVSGLGFNKGLGTKDSRKGDAPFPVLGVHGSAFLVRRSLLAQIVPIVEDCFLYHEDVQISWLIHLMGYEVYCVPESVIYHHYLLHMFPEKFYLLERNRWEMVLYSLQAGSLLRYLPILAATEFLVVGYSLIKGPRYAWAKLRAWNSIRSRLPIIRHKRAEIQKLRNVRDGDFLPCLRKGYPWSQLAHIARPTRRTQLSLQGRGPEGEGRR
jgi:GT2 family glycosyltransferase